MKKPLILIVAMPESIHTVRWLHQLIGTGWDIHLFPSYYDGVVRINKELESNESVKICLPYQKMFSFIKKMGLEKIGAFLLFRLYHLNNRRDKDFLAKRLERFITKYKPDLIHSLETQKAGYLVSNVRENFFKDNTFPTWWHTNWGSDIFLFGRFRQHEPLIRKVLAKCDYYSCECNRDVYLAKQFGFKGISFPVYPNTGGFDPAIIYKLRSESLVTSKRKIIMLKGYQGWAGRALVGIRALERCANVISGFTIIIYSNADGEDVSIASTLLSQNTGVAVKILPADTSHMEILHYHSKARISIGLSITDAISTSLLEAMALGSFPIQSCTACASEWFEDKVSGLLVTPEDPEIIELAIRKALSDDQLVDSAAEINYKKVLADANFANLKEKTISSYKVALQLDHV